MTTHSHNQPGPAAASRNSTAGYGL